MRVPFSALAALLLGGSLLLAGAAAPLEVRLEVHGKPAEPVPVRLRMTSEGSGQPLTREAMAPGGAVFEAEDLQGSGAWQLTAEAPGYWSPRVPVFPGDTQATVPLWPAGEVAGTVRMPAAEKLPPELTIRFGSSPEPGKAPVFPETVATCPVRDAGAKGTAAEGTFSCPVPAGKLDLRLRARGFVSHFRWGAAVPAGKVFQAGTLSLVRGASVIGRVDTAEGALSTETCKVELMPLAAGRGLSPEDLERRGGLALATGIDKRGFFHFEGVKPGSYILSARQPGYAPAEIFPVSVLEGAESDVRQPLVLQRALTLEVILDPPLDPWNASWVVELDKESAVPFSAESIGQAEPAGEGRFLRKGLAPGDYWVEVKDSRGSAFSSSEITLSPGSPPLEIRLPLVWVEGEVRLGDEPLAAQLWFGGAAGRERILMRSDAEGEFSGVLPHGGDWEVDLEAASPVVRRRVRNVAVREDKDTGRARVRIEVPDTRLAGEVVNEQGDKAPGARVAMVELETGRPAFVTADREGRFEAAGLPEGPVTLLASVADARSEELVVHVAEDSPSTSLRLVLRKTREVRGVVASPSGGVPGARVLALPRGGGAAMWPAALQAVADVEGKFTLKVPAGVASLQVVVLPPGFALTQLRVDDLSQETLTIPVSAQGGTLRVVPGDPAGEADPSDPASERVIVWNAGAVTDATLLGAWAAMNGAPAPGPSGLVVPGVQPGAYVACWTDLAGAYASLQQGAPIPGLDCASGVLSAGAELTLERPAGDP
ncbi:MAG TPA: carboxypeptidase-like regulatory domain-containing protein [Thermoanaerobaculia bacterium]|nr:carboxypeptidase-like regulatory domain-containing protein [Thermoanaerobaculia bacterium]